MKNLVLIVIAWAFCSSSALLAEGNVIEVPFEFHRQTILVTAKVDGQGPFRMIFDSGVDPSVFDLKKAKAIGLKVDPEGHPGSGGGTDANPAHETELPVVDLGQLRATHVECLAADLSRIGKRVGKPVDGVLGYSLLKDRIAQIDYPKRVIRFFSTEPTLTEAERAKSTTVSFRYHNDILVDDVQVNGKKVTANFDTGCNSAFQFSPEAVHKLGLEAEVAQAATSTSVGFNGQTTNREGHVQDVNIGGLSIHHPSAIFFAPGTGHDDEGWEIRIGNAFFKDFVLTLDYQRNTITLRKP